MGTALPRNAAQALCSKSIRSIPKTTLSEQRFLRPKPQLTMPQNLLSHNLPLNKRKWMGQFHPQCLFLMNLLGPGHSHAKMCPLELTIKINTLFIRLILTLKDLYVNALKSLAVATALAGASLSAQAGLIDSFVQTLPGAISPYADAGTIGNQLNGMYHITHHGETGALVPLYTNHPKWDYDNRYEENAHPFGAGLSRSIVDDKGNERMVYMMLFQDSHYEIEPIFGYAWVARYPIAQTGMHMGAGYTLGVTFRQDYSWMPIPVPLPLLSVGNETINLYGTYIPFTNVFFMFSRIQLNDSIRRTAALPESSPFHNTTQVYAQGSWVRNDLSSGDGDFTKLGYNLNLKDHGGYKVGVRQFLDRHWALDLSWQRSEHDLVNNGELQSQYTRSSAALQLQYHWEVADNHRLHLGAGVGMSQIKSEQTDYKDDVLHPVLQGGWTWALTQNLRLNTDMTVSFDSYKNVKLNQSEVINERFKPGAASFNVGLGWAF